MSDWSVGTPQTQNFSSFLQSLFGGGVQNNNPYTQNIMSGLMNQSNYAKQGMQGAYGNMSNLIGSTLGNYSPTNFLNQYMQNQGMVNQDYSQLMQGAQNVGQNAVQDVAGQFAGLGSLYSGGAAQNATTALATPMYGALQQAMQNRSSLQNNMLSGLASGNQAQLSAGMQGAGLYGQQGATMAGQWGNMNDMLAGYGSPLMSSSPSMMDYLKSIVGNVSSAIPGLGSLFGGGSGAGAGAGGTAISGLFGNSGLNLAGLI
jgi:hypothetical protein